MAAIRTIELADSLKSQRGTYTIQEFHNRSSLFPSTQNNKFFSSPGEEKDSNICNQLDRFHLTCKKAEANKKDSRTNANKPPSGSKHLQRPQSAKSRREIRSPKKSASPSKKNLNQQENGTDTKTPCNGNSSGIRSRSQAWGDTHAMNSQHYSDSERERNNDSHENMLLVPSGGKEVPVVDIGDEAPFPSYYFQKKRAEKYVSPAVRGFVFSSADSALNYRPSSAKVNHEGEKECGQMKRPSSAKSSRVKSDCDPVEITPTVVGIEHNRQVCGSALESGSSTNVSTFPFKLSDSPEEPKWKEEHSSKVRERPVSSSCLKPMMPSRNTSVTHDDLGIDPNEYCVFLPFLDSVQYAKLPILPRSGSPHGERVCMEKISPSPPPFKPKKYKHPAFVSTEGPVKIRREIGPEIQNKKPLDEWVCKHGKPKTSTSPSFNYYDDLPKRPIGVVRKEIEDLENLLRGIAVSDSSWGLVQYQAEIDKFRQTYEETMAKVPRRLLESQEPVDTFGLRKFYSQHDEVMSKIRQRHTLCLMELAELEIDVGIESDRKYFKHQIYQPYDPD